ncbi:hypothetical protein ACVWXP_003790 [Bradyrhizobium sp. USDA 4463]
MEVNANILAYVALFGWPFLSIPLFFFLRLPVAFATCILGADLLLPAGLSVKFEMVPAFDKSTIACLSAVVGCSLAARRLPFALSNFKIVNILIVAYLASPFITSSLNGDAIQSGDRILPGVGLYDAGSAFVLQFIFISPLLLARQIIRTDRDVIDVFRVLVISGTLYSALLLFEVRMSPSLHYWIYGYYPSQFVQAVRDGGYRPMAFMGHGLLASFFLMSCVVAAAALSRINGKPLGISAGWLSAYLSAVLIACKSLGSLVYGLALAPLVRWASPRLQIHVALILAIIGLTYPVTRSLDLFPQNTLVALASSVSKDRSDSLAFRFRNEDELLAKASERFWFGWGRYGRNRVYSENGRESITDGRWIITLGQFGAFGFLTEFGLLALPIFYAIAVNRRKDRIAFIVGALALLQAARIIDQLPNASINSWAWLITGSLLGAVEGCKSIVKRHRAEAGHAAQPLVPRSPTMNRQAT